MTDCWLASALAFFLTHQLERVLSRPVAELVGAAREVSRRQDFSIRVESRSRDEIGSMVAEFNCMLGEIEARDAECAAERQ